MFIALILASLLALNVSGLFYGVDVSLVCEDADQGLLIPFYSRVWTHPVGSSSLQPSTLPLYGCLQLRCLMLENKTQRWFRACKADGFTDIHNLDIHPASSICSLPITVGPCRAAFPSFGFDSKLGECRSFLYGGCEGNDNRFPTLEACQKECPKTA